VLTEDDQLRAWLAAIRSALADHGRFVFETRKPLGSCVGGLDSENAPEIVRAETVVRMAKTW